MGIRVHKKLGYGIDDLKVSPDDPNKDYPTMLPDDPRWDYQRYEQTWRTRGNVREQGIKDFRAWCEINANRLIELACEEGWSGGMPEHARTDVWLLTQALKDREDGKGARDIWYAPYSAFDWDSEFGMANVVLFQDPAHPDWSRYDDIIDYYEERVGGRATQLQGTCGIWPYTGTMIRFRDPSPEVKEKLDQASSALRACCYQSTRGPQRGKPLSDITKLTGGDYNRLTGFWDPKQPPEADDPDILRHFLDDWRAPIPVGILAVMEYMGCFPDIGTASMRNSLRPMIYVYWA